jgi:glycosyltransferase involved in cell wall biosynthesis
MKENITFLVFTFNEERRIEYILRCFHSFGEIVLLDGGSTDRTEEIARKYGARLVLRPPTEYGETESMARFAQDQAKTEWVYWAYADEILPRKLLRKLQEVSRQDRYKIVNIPRKNLHYGLEILNLASSFLTPRFFRKGFVDFRENKIHGMGRFTGRPEEVLNLPVRDEYSIHHCSTYNIRKFEQSHSGYSDTEAGEGKRFNPMRLLLDPPLYFLRYYLLGGGWRSGWAGLIMTMQYCFFFFNIQAKIWERERGITLESIEQNYDAIKERLLREADGE